MVIRTLILTASSRCTNIVLLWEMDIWAKWSSPTQQFFTISQPPLNDNNLLIYVTVLQRVMFSK